MQWNPYENGKTKGITYIDSIVLNDEVTDGARIILTKNRADIPYVITFELCDIKPYATVYDQLDVAEKIYERMKESYIEMRQARNPVRWHSWLKAFGTPIEHRVYSKENEATIWINNFMSAEKEGNAGICPLCGTNDTEYVFVYKSYSEPLFIAVWCEACESEATFPFTRRIPHDRNMISEKNWYEWRLSRLNGE